jgi:hypothetical protein
MIMTQHAMPIHTTDVYHKTIQWFFDNSDWNSCTYYHIGVVVQKPTVGTRSATSIAETAATLNGEVTDDGGASIDERRFDWGTTSSCSDGWVTDNPSSGHYGSFDISGNSFSYRLTGLQPNTKYYFRAWAKNSAGWGWGTALSFTTSQNQAPTLSSGYVTPSSGDTSTTFDYYVTYADADGDAPTTKYVYIDGTEHTMTLTSGSYTSGATFKYSTTLSAGSHNYYFDFDDGHDHPVKLPLTGSNSGPAVSQSQLVAPVPLSPGEPIDSSHTPIPYSSITFTWTKNNVGATYRLYVRDITGQVDDVPSIGAPLVNLSVGDVSSYTWYGAEPNKKYRWGVQAEKSGYEDAYDDSKRLVFVTSPTPTPPPSFIEGFNVDGIVNTTKSYGGAPSFYAFEYTPSISYNLKKVELMAGRGTGTVIIQLRPDDKGMPSNIVLRETSFTQIDTVSWQGAEFTTPYPLTAGATYWIVFTQIANSQMSVATSGDIITCGWTIAGFTYWWTFPLPWMAKFYGEGKETTPPTWDTTVGIQSATDTGNGGEVTVTYGTATDADSPPVKYNVYFSTSSPATGGTKVSNVGSSPYTVTGLTNGQLYFFSVRAEDSATLSNEDTNMVELTATPTGPTAGTLGVEDAWGNPNTYVDVPVNITNTTYAITGIQFNILYNSTVINLAGIEFGDLTSTGWSKILGGTAGANVIILDTAPSNAIGIGESGSVVLLNFSVENVPGLSSPMNISDIKLADTSIPPQKGTLSPKNGTFTVVGGLGSISGKITYTCNTTGIAGATVNLTCKATAETLSGGGDGGGVGVINSTVTDSNGEYTFTDVPFGDYELNASKVYFWDNATDVTVTAGAPTEADMMLWLKGDVYNDGVLDIYDIIMLRQAAAENIPWDYRYDLYADAMVDIYDIIVLRQAVAGNIVLE